MSVINCITDAAEAGELRAKAAREAEESIRRYQEEFENNGRLSPREAEVRAAQRLEKELDRGRKRRKRMKILQASKTLELNERLRAAAPGEKDKAALSVLDFDPSGRQAGDNVAATHQSLRGEAWALATDFITKFRSKAAGLKKDTADIGDVVKGLFGEETTKQAEAFAKGVMEARNYLVKRHNAAGGDIRIRKDWGWVQTHDADKLRGVPKDEWTQFTLDRLDRSKMFDPAGQPMTERGVRELVEQAYDDIIGVSDEAADAAGAFGSPVSKRIAHRELAFRDAAAWIEYQNRFGKGEVLESIIQEIDKLARDTALIETLGPYPRATMKAMEDLIDKDRAVSQTGKPGNHGFFREVFDQVSGGSNIAESDKFARIAQGARNLITSARLGSAIFLSVSDFGTAKMAAKFAGLPFNQVMGNYFGQLTGNIANKRMAARMGFITETWLGDMVATSRLMGEVDTAAKTAKLADISLRLSGLSAHTESIRNAFKLTFVGELTAHHKKTWNKIPELLRTTMERHGLTREDWNLYRSSELWTDPETGATFIRFEDMHKDVPDSLKREANLKAAKKFHSMVAAEGRFAVPEPTARSKALTTRAGRPGSFFGEASRTLAQFKSFTIALTYMHGARIRASGLAKGGAQFAQLAIYMTMAGAFAEQLGDFAKGKEPRDMADPLFWTAAMLRGGSFGPAGDLLFSDQTRYGRTPISGVLGPGVGSLEDFLKLTGGNIRKAIEGEDTTVARDLRRLASGFTPGGSLWYTRLAMDRMIEDQLELLADPKAKQRFRRSERRTRKEFDQRFWWRKGDFLP